MGRKKKKKSTSSLSSFSPEMIIISMILISLLMGVLIYTNAGQVGGLFGIIKYVIPIGIFITAISLMKENTSVVTTKVTQFLVFTICVSAIIHIFQFSKLSVVANASFEEIVNAAYMLGTTNQGGGAIGAIIATPLSQLIGSVGAAIITIAIAIITFIYIIGITPTELVLNFLDSREERKQERMERREEEKNAFNERIEERRKNRHLAVENKKQKAKLKEKDTAPAELIQDELVINHFNDGKEEKEEKEFDKKPKFSLFGKKESTEDDEIEVKNADNTNPDELENIFKEVQEEKEEKTKSVLQLEHFTHTVDDENYEIPPIELLSQGEGKVSKGSKKALADTATKLQKTLYSFGVSAKVENVSVGPAITRYELKPAEGVRVSKIAKLADDIALNLAAESIRIEAPIPGKQAVGIEIPNSEKEVVPLRDIIDSPEFENSKSKLAFALGKGVSGDVVVTDIAKMPHVLIH